MTRGSKVLLSVIVGFIAGLYAVGSANEVTLTSRGVVDMTDPFEVRRAMSDPSFRQILSWGPISLEGWGWPLIVPALSSVLFGISAYFIFGRGRGNAAVQDSEQNVVQRPERLGPVRAIFGRWLLIAQSQDPSHVRIRRELAIFLALLASGGVLALLAGSFGFFEISVTHHDSRGGTYVRTVFDDGRLVGVLFGPYLLSVAFRFVRAGINLIRR